MGTQEKIDKLLKNPVSAEPLVIEGFAEEILPNIKEKSVDMCMTSPPYWGQRTYGTKGGIGNEKTPDEYVSSLIGVFKLVKKVLKERGSLWLNIGDKYSGKDLVGLPWLAAFALKKDGWILRNSVVWNKVKGNPCNAKDKLRNMHEIVFHFVLKKSYYYDVDAIRNDPAKPYSKNGILYTPTGVSGSKYRQQILNSDKLTEKEKNIALEALETTLLKIRRGKLYDFRMIIRGEQRTTHSDKKSFSGRAEELDKYGFYILPYHKNGPKPGDVWDIIPEDSWRKDNHYAVYPEELCYLPIKATAPEHGIVLDPFLGTGTTLVVAKKLGRTGIGIEPNREFAKIALERLRESKVIPEQKALL
jgi:DNA modification methylase